MSEIRQVTITIRSPTDYDHEGMAEIGHYTVCDGFVQLVNETGTKPLGKPVKIGADSPERVAGRLTRVLWSKRLQDRNGFNRNWAAPGTVLLTRQIVYPEWKPV